MYRCVLHNARELPIDAGAFLEKADALFSLVLWMTKAETQKDQTPSI